MRIKLPRVTEVLVRTGVRSFPFIPEDKREWYLQRGTAIHEATRLDDMGMLDEHSVDPRIGSYLEAWRKFRLEVAAHWELVDAELHLESAELGYQGTIDRVYRYVAGRRKKVVIVDIKTGGADAATALQTWAYAAIYKEKRSPALAIADRMAVELKEEGKYALVTYGSNVDDRIGWEGSLGLYRWKERNGVK